MWKALWQKWTIEKPAALGELLWDALVVQFAAFLDKLTLRRIIALIPVVVVILATVHRIPIPPELMLVGDALAYIDVLSVLFPGQHPRPHIHDTIHGQTGDGACHVAGKLHRG